MSSFTNWNGPQSSAGVKTADVLALINEYSRLVTTLNEHLSSTATSDNVHQVKDYVNSVKQELIAMLPNVSGLISKIEADAAYVKSNSLPDFSSFAKVSDLTRFAEASALNDYLKKNELDTTDVINMLKTKVNELEAWVNSNTKTIPELLVGQITGVIKAVEQIKLTFKKFNASVGGSNNRGVYYLLGMLDERVGTAYIRFTDTKSFAAVINFAVTTDLDAQGSVVDFKNGQLSVVTDADKADLSDVHFLIVKGTNAGEQHVYLAVQASDWVSKFASTDGVGLFNTIPFEASGINFVPVGLSEFKAPTGTTAVLVDLDYYALEDRVSKVEHELGTLTKHVGIGEITFWNKYNENGIAVDVPEWAHACDGSSVPEELRPMLGLEKFPLQDYAIIRVLSVAERP